MFVWITDLWVCKDNSLMGSDDIIIIFIIIIMIIISSLYYILLICYYALISPISASTPTYENLLMKKSLTLPSFDNRQLFQTMIKDGSSIV